MRRAVPFVALVLLACAPAKPGPAEAYRAFAAASAKRDVKGAWPLLSKDSQALLTESARAVAIAERKPAPDDGRAILFLDANSRPAVKQTEAVFDSADVARVLVLDEAGGRGSVRFVREEGLWKLDVTEELRRVSAR